MKHLQITGLCLVSIFTLSMAMTATASAAPHWLVCLPATSGSTATKYSEHQCAKAEAGGGWEWSELRNTELSARLHGTLTLEDEVVAGAIVEIKCSSEDEGTIGPRSADQITAIRGITCTAGHDCATLDKAVEPVNLPWKTELFETENTIRDVIKGSGKGEPGWKFECTVGGIKTPDECSFEGASTLEENLATPTLLVLGTFAKPNNPKAKCTITKAKTGDLLGSIALLLTNGWGLRVSK